MHKSAHSSYAAKGDFPIKARMKSLRLSLLVVTPAVLALGGLSAIAGFSYSDFSSTAGLQLNGAAAQLGNELRLVNSVPFAGGSAFTTASTPLGGLNSFSTYFQFRIDNNAGIGDGDGVGADGLAFVIQTVSNNVGSLGGGIGYQGIANSVGIEFDTYNNGGPANDPDGNHVGIDLNGNIASVATASEPTRFNNGSIWNAWVDYDGTTNALEVRWSQAALRPAAAQLSSVVNLQTVLGQNSAFLGFTSATGSGYGDHNILNWEYRDSFSPINPAVPEPTSALFALGIVGVALRQRSRRA